ncbi:MAG: glycosyltransferase, partial [archaeon]|nr:glycosyltransferase [archaeon]
EDLHQCSLVLMPSRQEPFGLAGLEALSAGVPVMISRQSGLHRISKNLRDPIF